MEQEKTSAEQAEDTSSASDRPAGGDYRSAEYEKLEASYKSLRADYTRKCQKLASLTRAARDAGAENGKEPPARPPLEELVESEEFYKRYVYGNERIRERVLADCIGLLKAPPRLLTGAGAPAAADAPRPRTLEEAGELAKNVIIMK